MRALLLPLLACVACNASTSRERAPARATEAPGAADTSQPTEDGLGGEASFGGDVGPTQARLRIEPGLEPTAYTYGNPRDLPVEIDALALVRLDRDAMTWERVRFEAEPRLVQGSDRFAVEDWLGLELRAHETYALRARVGERTQDLWIMVSEIVCQDIMLPPPPVGTRASCIATPDGALATYVVPPTAALEAAPR